MDRCGLEGYGFYWFMLETVASLLESEGKPEVTYSVRKWSSILALPPQTFKKLMQNCCESGLVSCEFRKSSGELLHEFEGRNNEVLLTVKIPNLLKYRDEYSSKKKSKSGQTPKENPDNVPLKEKDIELKEKELIEKEAIAEKSSPCGSEKIDSVGGHQDAPMSQQVLMQPPMEIVGSFPLVDGSEFCVTKQMAEEFSKAYPAVDIPSSIQRVRVWCLSNPKNRKTRNGAMKFLNAWLGKDQNSARTEKPRQANPFGKFAG